MPRRKPIVPMRYPVGQEYAYRRILLHLNKQYREVLRRRMVPHVETMAEEATVVDLPTGEVRQDIGWAEQLQEILLAVSKDMTAPTNAAIRRMLAVGPLVDQHNQEQWRRLVRSQYGVDPTREDPKKYDRLLETWSQSNARLIRDIPRKTTDQISQYTREVLVQGTNVKDTTRAIKEIMEDRVDVSDSRARLIARDQVSKLNGNLTRERQTDMGVSGYIWRTVGDERVRDTHVDNDGKFFSWDAPPSETGHPGEDYQCRCWAEPVLSEFIAFEASLLEEVE